MKVSVYRKVPILFVCFLALLSGLVFLWKAGFDSEGLWGSKLLILRVILWAFWGLFIYLFFRVACFGTPGACGAWGLETHIQLWRACLYGIWYYLVGSQGCHASPHRFREAAKKTPNKIGNSLTGTICSHQISGDYDMGTVVDMVVQNSQNPALLGIQNDSSTKWPVIK